MEKTNIIYFVGDQMRNDSLHHMGCEASITPNLDDILKDGISFENAYCQNPVCVPSRCSFMSGLYPHTTGHRTMHYLQDESEPNFLRTMKNNGYEVIWVGRNDIVPANRSKVDYCDIYFDGIEYKDNKEFTHFGKQFPKTQKEVDETKSGFYSHFIGKISQEQARSNYNGMVANDWNCVESALRYLEERKSDKPFFLYLTISFPHPPYACEEPWFSSIDRSKIETKRPSALTLDKPSMLKGICRNQNLENWLKENYIEMKSTYLAMVSRFDYQFGMLKKQLKDLNLYDNSNIFVFADHGDYTGDYSIAEKVQNCFEDPISNIPLLIKPAKQFSCKPRKSKALVELVDLCETVCDMTGIKTEYVQFGKSLLPVLAGSEDHKDAVFCEGGRIHGETWAMELGHDSKSQYWPRLHEQGKEGAEHTKATMIRMENLKYIRRLYEKDELYDLEKDPLELTNLIDDNSYQKQLLKLKERMLMFYQETSDIVPNRKDIR
ncbi:MAG: sulfatase-like hydrolase/transferase [Erysipelotrichaceae bacterium]